MLPAELCAALRSLQRNENVTLYMLLLAAFQALLSRLSGQADILVGSPVAGRTHERTEGLIGFFVNTLVMRVDTASDPSFVELLSQVRTAALEAYAHQDVPFEKLVSELQPERDLSRAPLFQVLFALHQELWERRELPRLQIEGVSFQYPISKFDLSLHLHPTPTGELAGVIEYATDLFEAGTIRRWIGYFQRLLELITAAPDLRLSQLQLMSDSERGLLLQEWNDTEVE